MKFDASVFQISTVLFVGMALSPGFAEKPETDSFDTPKGTLTVYFLGHGTLMLDLNGYIIHVDPVSSEGDYKTLPKADLVLITHHHPDHLDKKAVKNISTGDTIIICNEASSRKLKGPVVMTNGDSREIGDLVVHAVPAYNTTRGRKKFHPQGRDNGYVLDIGGFRVYIAGDTEFIPEMENLRDIAVAFLPVNQPFTMTVDSAAAAAEAIMPDIFYPYHYGRTDVESLKAVLDGKEIEVRIRNMK